MPIVVSDKTEVDRINNAIVNQLGFSIDISGKDINEVYEKIDNLEQKLMVGKSPEFGLDHTFTPGLYSRKIFMPAGSVLTSKIHKTEHQYVVLSGLVYVWTEMDGLVKIEGPYVGVTKANTRRILVVIKDTEWITFHPTKQTDVQSVEEEIIQKRDIVNHLMIEGSENKQLE